MYPTAHAVGWKFALGQTRRSVLRELEVAPLFAGVLLAEFQVGFGGGFEGVGVVAEGVADGLVVEGPDFHVRGNVVRVRGFDQVDLVSAIVMGGAWPRIPGVADIFAEFISRAWFVRHESLFPNSSVAGATKLHGC
jgi:hypothetical protein